MEYWRDIKGYEGLYQVSNLGRVKSLKRYVDNFCGTKQLVNEKILSEQTFRTGYNYVSLCINGCRVNKTIHRLVAEAFIPNTFTKEKMSNARIGKESSYKGKTWTQEHKVYIKEKLSKPVYQYEQNGELVKIYKSLTEAHGEGYKSSAVSSCCHNKRKKYKGYRWSYTPL